MGLILPTYTEVLSAFVELNTFNQSCVVSCFFCNFRTCSKVSLSLASSADRLVAQFVRMALFPIHCPCIASSAFSACSFTGNDTKPYPFDFCVVASRIILASLQENWFRIFCTVEFPPPNFAMHLEGLFEHSVVDFRTQVSNEHVVMLCKFVFSFHFVEKIDWLTTSVDFGLCRSDSGHCSSGPLQCSQGDGRGLPEVVLWQQENRHPLERTAAT